MAVVPNYNALPNFVSFSDLINHAVAFFTLYLLLERAYPDLKYTSSVTLLVGYAVLIEAVQYFLPNRCASFSDVVADSVGILIAVALLPLIHKLPFCGFCYRQNKSV